MPNTLNLYDPLFYAQEGLIQLTKALGMAGRVYRGLDRTPQSRGSVINISKPSTFTAQDAPSTAQDITPGSTAVTLNKWKEVKFALTDKELTFTGEKIIEDHIRPAAYALAADIDANLNTLYQDVPWFVSTTSPAAVADITAVRKVLFNNGTPMVPGDLFLEIDGTLESELLNLSNFSQQQGAGDLGVATQQNGSLGRKYGFDIFANQQVATHTAGVSADVTGVAGVAAAGATTIGITAISIAGTVKKGDTFVIAGNAQRYAFTANFTADGAGAIAAATFTPPLAAATVGSEVLTITLLSGVQNMGFHRNAFALAMAPLSDVGAKLGARVETVTDPVTGLALRSRMFYVGDTSKVYVALDVLYGYKTLDPNLACRLVD